MNTNNEQPRTATYLLLLAVQLLGAMTFIWQALPEFRLVAAHPGEQLPREAFPDLLWFSVFCVMQCAFWYRVYRVPIPLWHPHLVLQHVFLFLGRLSFVFGSALFGIVVFRHLPELDRGVDLLLIVKRAMILTGCLFALFCTTLEVERLGRAFERGHRH